ncbi:MAG: UDP-N-acetylmuramoyl-L-alanyl-D-glutamate--2,6-diaminopimelate ligase, partial [Armatimonadetes bacterium]|nr:UDP-N-acetylmuramoyl-L-alanyl-D-glutamate--2,6-diaminopimelate ligase [Armatimonadota bacterium]
MPTLSSLSTALATSSREGPGGDPEIRGLALDSRQVQRGDLFFCIPGLKADGRRFLPQAVRQGAVAAVVEGPVPDAE